MPTISPRAAVRAPISGGDSAGGGSECGKQAAYHGRVYPPAPTPDDAEPRGGDTGSGTGSGTGSAAGSAAVRGRLATRILQGGEEPDPRFTLANERTFLAWIRTSLALLAGGIAVEAFTSDLFVPSFRKTIAVVLLLLALALAAFACFRWLSIERAMRHRTPLPLPLLIPLLGIGGVVVSAVVIVFVITRPA